MRSLTLLVCLLCLSALKSFSQATSGVLTVGGDLTKYYPVSVNDAGYDNNEATVFKLGRSSIHQEANWRGAIIAEFRFHTTNWGNGAHFIDANITQGHHATLGFPEFVGTWRDVTGANSDKRILIWLRGGTTYQWKCNFPTIVTAHLTSYSEPTSTNPIVHLPITTLSAGVNQNGYTFTLPAYFTNPGTQYFNGNIGIGTKDAGDARLAVNGTITAKKVKVTATGWPDYVFENGYPLMAPDELAAYIRSNKHLPGVPSADSVHQAGVDLGEMNKILLKKIEELTLYMLQQQEQIKRLEEGQKKLTHNGGESQVGRTTRCGDNIF